jgi:hypothetical protein
MCKLSHIGFCLYQIGLKDVLHIQCAPAFQMFHVLEFLLLRVLAWRKFSLLFGRCLVRIYAGIPATLTEVFRDLLQSIQTNARIVQRIDDDRLLHISSVIPPHSTLYHVYIVELCVSLCFVNNVYVYIPYFNVTSG